MLMMVHYIASFAITLRYVQLNTHTVWDSEAVNCESAVYRVEFGNCSAWSEGYGKIAAGYSTMLYVECFIGETGVHT